MSLWDTSWGERRVVCATVLDIPHGQLDRQGWPRLTTAAIRGSAVAMSIASRITGAIGSPSFARREGMVAIVKRVGSSRAVISDQRRGQETGAPGSGRADRGATIV